MDYCPAALAKAMVSIRVDHVVERPVAKLSTLVDITQARLSLLPQTLIERCLSDEVTWTHPDLEHASAKTGERKRRSRSHTVTL